MPTTVPPRSVEELLEARLLAPLLPLLDCAWNDGLLTREELRKLGAAARAQPWLDLHAQTLLAQWVDPDEPPTASELAQLRAHLRREVAREVPAHHRVDLAELGARLGRDPALAEALAPLQHALGVDGVQAARQLQGPAPAAPATGVSMDPAALRALLDRSYPEVRARVRALLADDPRFRIAHVDERDTAAYRAQVLAWLRALADAGVGRLAFPPLGEAKDLGAFIAAFATLAHFDLSLTVKAGVQFGLFGGSLYFLGTERHHALLPRVASLELPGCFAMSELGHGSNVRELRTVARYDAQAGAFELHTPDDAARKEWIGNAAVHGRLATVFAQLHAGGAEHGVHAFLVPIRGEDGAPAPGVRIEDCGLKMGLNGVDNGRLWFDHVRVPREALLDRFAQVAPDGTYTSPIPSESRRFFTMLGTLVAGRVSVACASLSAAKSGLAIAVRYAEARRQFGPAGGEEVRLLDYPSHQQRLLVPLAHAYALHFALEHLVARYVGRTEADAQQVEALAAGLKAEASAFCTRTLQAAREACGGQGYLWANRLPALKADSDIFTTFEGDNTVLLQLVAKALLTGFRQQFEDDRVFAVLRLVAARASAALTERNPLVVRRTASEHLRGDQFQLAALRYREEDLVASAAARLRKRLSAGVDAFEAFNQVQPHLLALAQAHVERVVLEQFQQAVAQVEDAGLRAVLQRLCDLHGLSRVDAASGWLQEHGVLEDAKARAVRREVGRLCAELRPDALALVDAFGIPDAVLAAPIAFGRSG